MQSLNPNCLGAQLGTFKRKVFHSGLEPLTSHEVVDELSSQQRERFAKLNSFQDRPLRLRDDTARALSTASESADTHSAPTLAQPERRATPARMGNCTCFTVYR